MSADHSIRTVGLCGAGQMGAAAAVCFRRAGYRTLLWLRNPDKLAAVRDTLDELESWMQEHVGAPSCELARLDVVTDLSVLDNEADAIMDCIAEVMSEKAALLSDLPRARARRAMLLTTTSGLSISELGRRSGTGQHLVGTHFWNPPHLMPLVEVIAGDETEPEVMDRAIDLIRAIGKIPVRVNRDVLGFIGNRLQHALWREAIFLVQSGVASAEDVDRVARLTFALRMPAVGPLENMDLVGLDLVQTIHRYLMADLADDDQPLPLLCEHVAGGELGMKTGRGFYNWKLRDPKQTIERRDRQIVQQLEFLRKLDAL